MKGILNSAVNISVNEMLAKGTKVEILYGWCGCDGNFYRCEIDKKKQVVINSDYIDITDHRPCIDWEQRRFELAKSAMQGYISQRSANSNDYLLNVAKDSVRAADALINELRLTDNH